MCKCLSNIAFTCSFVFVTASSWRAASRSFRRTSLCCSVVCKSCSSCLFWETQRKKEELNPQYIIFFTSYKVDNIRFLLTFLTLWIYYKGNFLPFLKFEDISFILVVFQVCKVSAWICTQNSFLSKFHKKIQIRF